MEILSDCNQVLQIKWRRTGAPGEDAVASLLAYAGIRVSDESGPLLVTVADCLDPLLNQIALSVSLQPWWILRPGVLPAWIGPMFRPGDSVCWPCLAHCLRTRQPVDKAPHTGTWPPAAAIAPLLRQFAARSVESGVVFSFRDSGDEGIAAPVPRREHCDCTPRVGLPLDEWANNVTGLLANPQAGQDEFGFWHCAARHVFPVPRGQSRSPLPPGSAFGSAQDLMAAHRSCIGEAIERYSSARSDSAAIFRSRASDLPGAIDLASLHIIPDSNAFDPAKAISWTPAQSLSSGEQGWIPACVAWLGYAAEEETPWAVSGTNGCAAGPTSGDALRSALLELIERDALAIWWYNRLARPSIPLEMVDRNSGMEEAVAGLRRAGRLPVLLDLTTDLGIPVYAAIAPLRDGSSPVLGCGADTDPAAAARKAFREMMQCLYWSTRGLAPALRTWLHHADATQEKWLRPAGSLTPRPFAAGNSVSACIGALEARGVEAWKLDLTRRDIGIPVWRVVAPGLRSQLPVFSPGRLFTVPVLMGWSASPCAPADLNPVACPL
ncbi:MAG: YcaO-like family protein [Bryobacteraceae bacterium]|nr:YcaO-like family protein [Bryobacteraceae bacterium]